MAKSQSRVAPIALGIAVLGTALALGGVLLSQSGVLAPMAGFGLFVLGSLACGAIGLLLGIIGMLQTRRQFAASRRRAAQIATCLSGALLAAVAYGASAGRDLPSINDITTDLADPPVYSAKTIEADKARRDMSRYPDDFVPLVQAAYPDLAPIESPLAPDRAYARALVTAKSLGWEITFEDPAARVFDATDTTRVFRFVDDVSVRVRPGSGGSGGSRVDIRSKSRDGRGDLGANADRIRLFASYMKSGRGADR